VSPGLLGGVGLNLMAKVVTPRDQGTRAYRGQYEPAHTRPGTFMRCYPRRVST